MCVAISVGKNNARLFLMEPVVKALEHPEFVGFMEAGSNIGIYAEDNVGEYKVTYKATDGSAATPSVSVSYMVNRAGIKQGVYDCHVEAGGLVVFNISGPFSEF